MPEHGSWNPTVPTLKLRYPAGWFPGSERFPHSSHCFSAYQSARPCSDHARGGIYVPRCDSIPKLIRHPEGDTRHLMVDIRLDSRSRSGACAVAATRDSIQRAFDLQSSAFDLQPSAFNQPSAFDVQPASQRVAVPAMPSASHHTARAASAHSSAGSTHPHRHPRPAKPPGTSTRASIDSVDEGETSVLHDRAAMHFLKLRLDPELSIVYFPATQSATRNRKQTMPGGLPVVSTPPRRPSRSRPDPQQRFPRRPFRDMRGHARTSTTAILL